MRDRLIVVITALTLLWAATAEAHPVRDTPALAAPSAPPAVESAPERERTSPPEAPGALLALAALGAAIARLGSTRRRRKPVGALVSAGLLVALLAGSAPHLVHHALDSDAGADCQILQLVSHTDGTVDDAGAPGPVVDSLPVAPAARLPLVVASAPTASTRAPPA
jgi:hypothetical protein